MSDIEEESQFKREPSYREAARHSVMNDLECSDYDDDDEESKPMSNSAPGSLHYRVELKPTEETLKKMEKLDLLPHSEQPTTKTKKKKKHSFSSIARSIQSFLKSPSVSKKKHDWEEEEKKDACKQENESKKGGIRASIRRKLRRKSLKDNQRYSIDSVLTPSSTSTAGAITPSSLSSAEILDSPKFSKKHKKHKGFGDATTPGSEGIVANGEILHGHKSADSAPLFNIEIDDNMTISGDQFHSGRSKHSDYASRSAAYRLQGDNKRESKESEKIKNYPDYVPPLHCTATTGVSQDDTDGPNFSRENDSNQPQFRSLSAMSGPPRPTSLNVSPHTLRSFDRLGQVENLGLNGITEAIEVEMNERDGLRASGAHVVRLSADVVEDCSGSVEDFSSDEKYKPFKDRSDKEKEALYEKIAARLAAIGDRVTVDHAVGESMADELIGAVGGSSPSPKKEIQEEIIEIPIDEEEIPFTETDARQLGLRLRHHGDRRSSSELFSIPLSVLMSVVQNTRYDTFKGVASHLIGNDTSWRGLSLVLRLTGDAIKLAGRTPSAVTQIKDNSVKFINDKLAGWIASQGGWESVVEESISSSGSETEVD
uniref:Uncharacterized protein LOC102808133 n=1 Tax=Saccoglossus kowalevskii TaxID=10224 RepID=A0ABM0M559_SACKO|nr:PREDICTED: uncharacterized protein LOC102808133 [Saccoglossus kowalevskii]